MRRHTISLLLENESGALSRVAGLFSARAYNIESLSVAPTEDPSLSRLTLVTCGSEDVIEQITKQLNKLIDVVKLLDLTEGAHIERELLLVKIDASDTQAAEQVTRLAHIFLGKVIDVRDNCYTVELTGTNDKLDAFLKSLEALTIIETVRSGVLGVARGSRALRL